MRSASSRTWHGWRHPIFWKMLGADLLLLTLVGVAYPAPISTRLILVVLALLTVSVVLNIALTPPHRPHDERGDGVSRS